MKYHHLLHDHQFQTIKEITEKSNVQLIHFLHSFINDSCMNPWPNVTHCSEWTSDTVYQYFITNSVPVYTVQPYCPFGVGKGYCFPNGSTKCTQFLNLKCPAQVNAPPTGDVLVPQLLIYRVPSSPDPTSSEKPLNLYEMNSLSWYSNITANGIKRNSNNAPGIGYQVIGVHITGQQIKGPAEAEGYNVDEVGIPLKCGGHITPPVLNGPLYHYHKASLCIQNYSINVNISAIHFHQYIKYDHNLTDIQLEIKIEEEMKDDEYHRLYVSTHSYIQGFANDGFGIYGLYDLDGNVPIVDECNGHFGCLDDDCSVVSYHYHMRNFTFHGSNVEHFEPYWIGCLGPAKGMCNSTVHQQYDDGSNWCGVGCGYDICVQPETNSKSLDLYLNIFQSDLSWLEQFTINPY